MRGIKVNFHTFLNCFYKNIVPLLLLSRFSRVRLCNPIDGSPPGSAIPGILQVRTHRTPQKGLNDQDNHDGVVTYLESQTSWSVKSSEP